ncbi:MAG: hypothetical protein U1F34_09720 [Gammaproteobacteria bacterium]
MHYRVTINVAGESEQSEFTVRERGAIQYQGMDVGVVEFPSGGRDYLVRDQFGVRRIGTVRGFDSSLRLDDEQHYLIKLPATPGMSWPLTSQVSLVESIFYEAGEHIRDREVQVPMVYAISANDESVTVPAGTFEHCVKITANGSAIVRVKMGENFGHIDVAHTDWYAPGIGLVRSERRETSDSPYLRPGTYLQELISIDQ